MHEETAERCAVVNTFRSSRPRKIDCDSSGRAALSNIEQPRLNFSTTVTLNSSSKREHHRMRRDMKRKDWRLVASGGAVLLRPYKSLNGLGLVASVGLMTLLYAPGASAQVSPGLGNATNYGVLAGSQVTNTGTTTIQGNVGISPGIGPSPHFTGFGTVVFTAGGTVHDADVPAANAKADQNAVYNALDQG
jgi:hypothetical protein